MKDYLRELYLSLHDPLYYRRMLMLGQGIGFKYLLFVLSLGWLLMAVVQSIFILPQAGGLPGEYLRKIAPEFPDVIIKDGRVITDVPQPYIIHDSETGAPLFVIDLKGGASSLDATGARVLLAERSLWIAIEGEAFEYTLPTTQNGVVNAAMLTSLAEKWEQLAPFAAFMALPVNIFFSLIGFLSRWVILALAAYLVLRARFDGITLEQGLRFSSRVLTASMLLSIVIYGLGVPFMHPDMVLLATSFLYLFFGIAAATRTTK